MSSDVGLCRRACPLQSFNLTLVCLALGSAEGRLWARAVAEVVGGEGKKRGCGTWAGGDPADSTTPHVGLDVQ